MFKCPELMEMNLASGLAAIRRKLPVHVQHKWSSYGQTYENTHYGSHPPFSEFVKWLNDQATKHSNDHYSILSEPRSVRSDILNKSKRIDDNESKTKSVKSVLKTQIKENETNSKSDYSASSVCYYHNVDNHSLLDCTSFRKLPFNERKELLISFWLCTRCLGSHPRSNCDQEVSCNICNLTSHISAMHIANNSNKSLQAKTLKENENSKQTSNNDNTDKKIAKSCKCTKICGSTKGKDCSKTVLVEITKDGDD